MTPHLPPDHQPQHLTDFLSRLPRLEKYLTSSKLHFHDGVLDLNTAPFIFVENSLPDGSPLRFLLTILSETCWDPQDLLGRRIAVQALKDWATQQLDIIQE